MKDGSPPSSDSVTSSVPMLVVVLEYGEAEPKDCDVFFITRLRRQVNRPDHVIVYNAGRELGDAASLARSDPLK